VAPVCGSMQTASLLSCANWQQHAVVRNPCRRFAGAAFRHSSHSPDKV